MSYKDTRKSALATLSLPDVVTAPPISAKALFWRSRYLRGSGFLHHIPFLFWLIETRPPACFVTLGLEDSAVAHFAACQGVDRLAADARCYGIDPWVGSEGKVPAEINAYNTEMYQEFSEFVVSDPVSAAKTFDAGPVDILLVNAGMAATDVEALLHDWTPQLSERAVVMIHGTRQEAFAEASGQAVLSRLAARYPLISFNGGDGLAVLLVGAVQDEQLVTLAGLRRGVPGFSDVHQVFTRLGEAHHFEFLSSSAGKRLATLEQDLEGTRAEHARLSEAMRTQAGAYDARNRQTAELQSLNHDLKLQIKETELQVARATSQYDLSQAELATLRNRLEETDSSLRAEILALTEACDSQGIECDRLQQQSEAQSRALDEQRTTETGLRAEIARLADHVEQDATTLSRLGTELEAHRRALSEQSAREAEAQRLLRQALTEKEQEAGKLQARVDAADAAQAQLEEALGIRFSELAILTKHVESQLVAQRVSNAQAEKDLQALSQQNERLTRDLAAAQARDAAQQDKLKQESARVEAAGAAQAQLEEALDMRFAELAALTAHVESQFAEQRVSHAQAEKDLQALRQQNERLTQDLAAAQAREAAQQDKLKQESARLEAESQDRFKEIAILVREHEKRLQESQRSAKLVAEQDRRQRDFDGLIRRFERERDVWRHKYETVVASTSWKMTGFMRGTMNMLRSKREH